MSLIFAIAVGIVFWFMMFALYWLITSNRKESSKHLPQYLVEEYDEAVERNR
ncbi:hypothetical protein [Ectobacillus funiculus]|uniref:Uncharacterized protein n=1 Tax=Ectobacillus funiculus TaxID=137993 RepID=A0ABV5WL59_9BACI